MADQFLKWLIFQVNKPKYPVYKQQSGYMGYKDRNPPKQPTWGPVIGILSIIIFSCSLCFVVGAGAAYAYGRSSVTLQPEITPELTAEITGESTQEVTEESTQEIILTATETATSTATPTATIPIRLAETDTPTFTPSATITDTPTLTATPTSSPTFTPSVTVPVRNHQGQSQRNYPVQPSGPQVTAIIIYPLPSATENHVIVQTSVVIITATSSATPTATNTPTPELTAESTEGLP